MLRKLTKAAAIAAFACLLVGFGFAEWRASNIPHPSINHNAATNKENAPNSQTIEERHQSTEEAIAYYNKWLMFFTAIMAIATIGLGFATVGLYFAGEKQIAVAKDSADAAIRQAKVAEDALFTAEIPYLYVVIKSHSIAVEGHRIARIGTMRIDGITIDEIDYSDHIVFSFQNCGRTPAEIIEFHADLTLEGWPPARVSPTDKPTIWATEVVPAGRESKERRSRFGSIDKLLFETEEAERDQSAAWFKGYVRYKDVFENEYIYGFFFGFSTMTGADPSAGEFYISGADGYNYRKKIKPRPSPNFPTKTA